METGSATGDRVAWCERWLISKLHWARTLHVRIEAATVESEALDKVLHVEQGRSRPGALREASREG